MVESTGPTCLALWLRFVDGRPVSAVTRVCHAWCAAQAAALGKRAVPRVWDNASWHVSQIVRAWLRTHHRSVKRTGQGVRLLVGFLPVTRPWLNPIEPTWLQGKKRVAEPQCVRSSIELADRVRAMCECPQHPPPPKPLQRTPLDCTLGSRYRRRLEVARFGFFGHSAGGAAATLACRHDGRCSGAVDLDDDMAGDVLAPASAHSLRPGCGASLHGC